MSDDLRILSCTPTYQKSIGSREEVPDSPSLLNLTQCSNALLEIKGPTTINSESIKSILSGNIFILFPRGTIKMIREANGNASESGTLVFSITPGRQIISIHHKSLLGLMQNTHTVTLSYQEQVKIKYQHLQTPENEKLLYISDIQGMRVLESSEPKLKSSLNFEKMLYFFFPRQQYFWGIHAPENGPENFYCRRRVFFNESNIQKIDQLKTSNPNVEAKYQDLVRETLKAQAQK